MLGIKELGMLNAGQFLGQGLLYAGKKIGPKVYLGEAGSYLNGENIISIGGGIGLQILAMTALKKQKTIASMCAIAGSHAVAVKLTQILLNIIEPVAPARMRTVSSMQYGNNVPFQRKDDLVIVD